MSGLPWPQLLPVSDTVSVVIRLGPLVPMISFSPLWLPTSLLDIGSYYSPLWLPGCLHDTKSNCLCLIAPKGKSTDQEPGLLRLLISCSVHNQTYLVNERMIYIPLPFHQFLFPVSMKALKSCIIHQSAHLLARLYNCSLMYLSIHQSGDKLWTYIEKLLCSHLGEGCR